MSTKPETNQVTQVNDKRVPGVTAYLVCQDAEKAIAYYCDIFGAKEIYRLQMPDGMIGHAEIELAGGRFMLADEFKEMNILSPASLGGSGVGLLIYVADADQVFDAAVKSGAVVFKEITEQFYGERSGTIDDPFGHRWTIATRNEEISVAEIQSRFQDLYCDEDD